MAGSISILLGAGFSAPMGYPIGSTLNDTLSKVTINDFSCYTDGRLIAAKDGVKPNFGWKNDFDYKYEFCLELIRIFNERHGYFDYEEFFDYLVHDMRNHPEAQELGKNFLRRDDSVDHLFTGMTHIYTQLVAFYIKDSAGDVYYDNSGHMGKPYFPGYTGILNCLEKLAESNDEIHVHTLNHDLFFERLNHTDWLKSELCDGFEELGSPYYGKLNVRDRIYNVRLERYTGKYNKKFRLYKLHGSRDYGLYYGPKGITLIPEMYLKTRFGVGFGDLYKETMDKDGNLIYENCWINYHADFLTGTTSKIERYREPLLYQILFDLFRKNLQTSDMLIIIGYGAKDSEINKMLLENFDFKSKPCIIIDPYPGKNVEELAKSLSAKIIKTHLEEIKDSEIKI